MSVFVAAIFFALIGGEPRVVELREVVALALEHNPALGAAIADVEQAEGGVINARGLDDFSLDAFGSWSSSLGDTEQATGSLQLSKPLASGGVLALRLQNEWIDAAHEPALELVFSHPILRGFGERTARAPQFRAAANYDRATQLRASAAAILLRDVSAAYWELSYAAEELAIRRASAAAAKDQLEVVKANIEVGKQSPSASAEVLVAIALREEEVFLAEQTARERSLELERLLGLELDATTPRLAASPLSARIEPIAAISSLLEIALIENPELSAARASIDAAAVDVDVTENGLLPQLDVMLAGGLRGAAAISELGRHYGLSASLVFSAPLPRNAAQGARRIARAGLQKAKLSAEEIERQIETTVLRIAGAVDTARSRIEVLTPSFEQAALDLEAERARFRVGRATNFDVLRRQEEVVLTQLRRARARADYHQATAALDAVTHMILARYQVIFR